MNKTEIIANNKLIFDFLGKEYIHWTHENRTSWISARTNLNNNVYKSFNNYEDLKYYESWGWIMSVIDKIEKLGYNTEIAAYHSNEKLHWCCIHETILDITNDTINIVEPIESNDKIECVYLACVKFIEYYNLQTSK